MDDDFMEIGETGFVAKDGGLFNPKTKEFLEHVEEQEDPETDKDEDRSV
jgi:hypothetical protein